jgi:sortase A
MRLSSLFGLLLTAVGVGLLAAPTIGSQYEVKVQQKQVTAMRDQIRSASSHPKALSGNAAADLQAPEQAAVPSTALEHVVPTEPPLVEKVVGLPAAAAPKEAARPLMLLEIPAISLELAVKTGIDLKTLAAGPGWYPTSVQPSQFGNVAIAGHRTQKGRPSFFYKLDRLKPGDDLYLTDQNARRFHYVVERVFVVSPTEVSVVGPTASPMITLTTCDPPGTEKQRLIVRARLIDGM